MKKSTIRMICFCILLVSVLKITNSVFKIKHDDGIYGLTKFYELEEDSVDVLILGSSHAFENFNTGLLWDEYGMSSFILAGSVQPMWNTYYYLKEALKTQTPQLIILEGYTTTLLSEYSDDSRIMKNTYGLKWSMDKINAVKISSSRERWGEFLLEYSQYHTRYTELSKEDFFKDKGDVTYTDWKGFWCNMETTPLEALDVSGVNEKDKLGKKTEQYYRKTIELAQENHIPILIVISPWAGITEEGQAKFNTAEDTADKGHLNFRGNQKYTTAVGKYMKENFDISDHRGDPAYQTWQKDADYISAMIENQLLVETTDKKILLEKILNSKYCLCFSIDGNCIEEELYDWLQMMGISRDSANGIYYRNNDEGYIWKSGIGDEEQYFTLDTHDFCLKREIDQNNKDYVNQIIIDNAEYKKVENGLNVVVYDIVTQRVIDSFGLNGDEGDQIVR